MLSTEHHELPMITIGTQTEYSQYLKYYEDGQFVNLLCPVNHSQLLAMCLGCLRSRGEQEVEHEKKHILVVGDNLVILCTMKAMLEKQYSVALATSGMKAMNFIGKKRSDLNLLDYEMSVCDGRVALEMIRGTEDLKDILVIFLTGVSDKEHIEAVLKFHPTGYFFKPVAEEALMAAIEKEFKKKRIHADNSPRKKV